MLQGPAAEGLIDAWVASGSRCWNGRDHPNISGSVVSATRDFYGVL